MGHHMFDGTSCRGWPFLFLSIILLARETCFPTTNMNALPFPPAPLAVLPTRRTYSLGSRGKSNSTTWSTPGISIPRDALHKSSEPSMSQLLYHVYMNRRKEIKWKGVSLDVHLNSDIRI